MLQKWTTTLIDDTNCLWDYIHQVRYHLKAYLFFFQLIHYLLWLPGRNVRKLIIRDNVKKLMFQNCSSIWNSAWCFVSEDLGPMNGQWVRVHTLTKGKHRTWHSMHFPYKFDQFCNFSFLTLPPPYSPYTRPSETILTNNASIQMQINRLFRDI